MQIRANFNYNLFKSRRAWFKKRNKKYPTQPLLMFYSIEQTKKLEAHDFWRQFRYSKSGEFINVPEGLDYLLW